MTTGKYWRVLKPFDGHEVGKILGPHYPKPADRGKLQRMGLIEFVPAAEALPAKGKTVEVERAVEDPQETATVTTKRTRKGKQSDE